MAMLIAAAREHGTSAYIGDGANHWPAVHRLDAAHLLHLAMERAPARSVLHGIAEQGVPTRAIAEAIGRGLEVPVVSVAPDAAGEHFGWYAGLFGPRRPRRQHVHQTAARVASDASGPSRGPR